MDESDQALGEALNTGGWARNESTRESALDFRRKGLATAEEADCGLYSSSREILQPEWEEWK